MGNIFSFFHCYKCKKRPDSLIGKKKHLCKPILSPLSIPIVPLVTLENNILENNTNIIYNSESPYLISRLNSPLYNNYK